MERQELPVVLVVAQVKMAQMPLLVARIQMWAELEQLEVHMVAVAVVGLAQVRVVGTAQQRLQVMVAQDLQSLELIRIYRRSLRSAA
jgi:hypothetical protein